MSGAECWRGRIRFVSFVCTSKQTNETKHVELKIILTRRTGHHTDTHPQVYSQTFFDTNYPDLSRWTKTVPNAPRSCYVTFGQGFSYFASAPGRGSVWAAIPTELSDKIQKAYDTPCCVALGVNNAWFVLWPDGYYSWKFYGDYAGLDEILRAAEPRSVSVSLRLLFVLCCEWVWVGIEADESSISPSPPTTATTTSSPSATAPCSTTSRAHHPSGWRR